MRILCSNDDGILADGLETLEAIAHGLSDDVWTVAPEVDQSGMSRSITLTRPLRARRLGEKRFAVDGTPTDCVQLALTTLVEGKRPDLILSGVNNGYNLADDVTVSGTVGVAFQGMVQGVPSIALSQGRSDRDDPPYEVAAKYGPEVIRKLLEVGWPRHTIVSINFPNCGVDDVKGIVLAQQGQREKVEIYAEEREDLRQRRYYWFGFKGHPSKLMPGTDLHAVVNNYVSITPLHLSLTDKIATEHLEQSFERAGKPGDDADYEDAPDVEPTERPAFFSFTSVKGS